MAKSSEKKKRKKDGSESNPILINPDQQPATASSSSKSGRKKGRGIGDTGCDDIEGRMVEPFVNGRPGNVTILRYPFGDPDLVETAAKGLPRCARLVPEKGNANKELDSSDCDSSNEDEISCEQEDVNSLESFEVVMCGDIKRLCAQTC